VRFIEYTRKPMKDCPLCGGKGVLPGEWHAYSPCGTYLHRVRPPCHCRERRPRGTDPVKLRKQLARQREEIQRTEAEQRQRRAAGRRRSIR
jgi:hypothetical protein